MMKVMKKSQYQMIVLRIQGGVISNLWNEREKHINTNYAVTGWMLCVIPHIRGDVFKIHKITIIFR